jgi:intracellular sulfur oxidation DsrE/DsrF family protein
MEKYKVVFHINDSNKWITLLANVINLIKDLGVENIIKIDEFIKISSMTKNSILLIFCL